MIVVTGGAGFIGSAIVWQLNKRGKSDIIVVDRLRNEEKWRNLVPLRFADYIDKEDFIEKLEEGFFGGDIEVIFHLGACSSTTEKDADYLIRNNYQYSIRIGKWWEKHPGTRFIYASSAATYGDGGMGYVDDGNYPKLRPPTCMGIQQMFDLFALRQGWLEKSSGLNISMFSALMSITRVKRSVVNVSFCKGQR